MDAPEMQVYVVQDIVRATEVARIPGLPEMLATEAVRRAQDPSLITLLPDAYGWYPTDALEAAKRCARLMASCGWRETHLAALLDKRGLGDGGHGHSPWQRDDRTPEGKADCDRIDALGAFSPEWWTLSLTICTGVMLSAVAEYAPGTVALPAVRTLMFRAGVARYNASKANVDRGLHEGDPDKYTTPGTKGGPGDYGGDVIRWAAQRWPTPPPP